MTSTQTMSNSKMAAFLIEEFKKNQTASEFNNNEDYSNINNNEEYSNDDYNNQVNTRTNKTNNKTVSWYLAKLTSQLIIFIISWIIYIFKNIFLFLYLYIKTFFSIIHNSLWFIIKYVASFYKPIITNSDKYLTYIVKYLLDIFSDLCYKGSIFIYKYWENKKYYTFEVGKQKYDKKDYARMASWIWEYETLTLKDIESRFSIWYATAIKVRNMRNDKWTMLKLLRETLEEESNVENS